MVKKRKSVSIELNPKKETEMANEDKNQQGDTSAEELKDKPAEGGTDNQQGGSGNGSEVITSDLGTSASIQPDTTTSSGEGSTTDSALVAAIGQQNQQTIESIEEPGKPAGDIVNVAEGDAGKDTSNENSSNGNVGAGSPEQSSGEATGNAGASQDQGNGQGQADASTAQDPVVQAAPAAAPASDPVDPAPAASTAPASEQTAPATLNPVSDLLNKALLKKEPSFKAQMILSNLQEYMEGMKAGKPVQQATQVKHQRNLHTLILQTINDLDDDEFKDVFTTICQAFDQDPTGCFQDTHIFRAWPALNLTGKQRLTAEYIIKLVMTLGPTKGREIAKQHINVESAIKFGINERGRHRIIDFFGIK